MAGRRWDRNWVIKATVNMCKLFSLSFSFPFLFLFCVCTWQDGDDGSNSLFGGLGAALPAGSSVFADDGGIAAPAAAPSSASSLASTAAAAAAASSGASAAEATRAGKTSGVSAPSHPSTVKIGC